MSFFYKTIFLLCIFSMLGCESVGYYSQAVTGQWSLWSQRQSIEKMIADKSIDPTLKEQLVQVQHIRSFATEYLALPDNNSYRYYSNLRRKYVVMNVFAAPEFSIKPKGWCFPIAGCVSYRGYFSAQAATNYAKKLADQGFDTYVGGVAAYSTLGWFDDPVLNTFIDRGEVRLAALIFHELAHQKIYIAGDTAFNEGFARAVEVEGVKRWLLSEQRNAMLESLNTSRAVISNDEQKLFDAYLLQQKIHEDFITTFLTARKRLDSLYQQDISQREMRRLKARYLHEIVSRDYVEFKKRWGAQANYDEWLNSPVSASHNKTPLNSTLNNSNLNQGTLNNAKLGTLASYHRWLPSFQKMVGHCDDSMEDFYQRVKHLARLNKEHREQLLLQRLLAGQDQACSGTSKLNFYQTK